MKPDGSSICERCGGSGNGGECPKCSGKGYYEYIIIKTPPIEKKAPLW